MGILLPKHSWVFLSNPAGVSISTGTNQEISEAEPDPDTDVPALRPEVQSVFRDRRGRIPGVRVPEAAPECEMGRRTILEARLDPPGISEDQGGSLKTVIGGHAGFGRQGKIPQTGRLVVAPQQPRKNQVRADAQSQSPGDLNRENRPEINGVLKKRCPSQPIGPASRSRLPTDWRRELRT
jgi:hypothetical protein